MYAIRSYYAIFGEFAFYYRGQLLVKAAPLILIAIGLSLGFRAGILILFALLILAGMALACSTRFELIPTLALTLAGPGEQQVVRVDLFRSARERSGRRVDPVVDDEQRVRPLPPVLPTGELRRVLEGVGRVLEDLTGGVVPGHPGPVVLRQHEHATVVGDLV